MTSPYPVRLRSLLKITGIALLFLLAKGSISPVRAGEGQGFPSQTNEAPKTNVAGGRRTTEHCKDLDVAELQPVAGVLFTTQDRPILINHIPPQWQDYDVFLNVTNAAGDELYQGILPMQQDSNPEQDGINAAGTFLLPKQVPALMEGQSYHWSMAVICNQDSHLLNPDDPFLSGVVQRVSGTNSFPFSIPQ